MKYVYVLDKKMCGRCEEAKKVEEFYSRSDSIDGYDYYCRSCRKDYNNKRRIKIEREFKEGVRQFPAKKRCSKCRRLLKSEEFTRSYYSLDGLESQCKSCRAERMRRKHTDRRYLNKELKACRVCKKLKDIDRFYVDKKMSDCRSNACKECSRKIARNNRKSNKEKRRGGILKTPDSKVCARCKIEKSSEEFCKYSGARDGLAGYCKSCHREYRREYYRKYKGKRKRDIWRD